MENGQRALIVDPEEDRGRRLASLCQQAGVHADVVSDGVLAAAAIDALTGAPLLVLQLTVSQIDAFDLIARFRQRFPVGGGAHVVALSSFPDLRATAGTQRAARGIDLILPNDRVDELFPRTLQLLCETGEQSALFEVPEATATGSDAEDRRRALIQRTGLDRLPLRPPDPLLQKFVQAVAESCGSPIALMTLALEERLVFPARHGIDATEVERYSSLCNKVIEAGEPLFVPDAQNNPAFHENGLVRAGVIRGYASAPVHVGDGPPIGTLCLIHSGEPLRLDLGQVRSLRQAVTELGEMLVAKRSDGAE